MAIRQVYIVWDNAHIEGGIDVGNTIDSQVEVDDSIDTPPANRHWEDIPTPNDPMTLQLQGMLFDIDFRWEFYANNVTGLYMGRFTYPGYSGPLADAPVDGSVVPTLPPDISHYSQTSEMAWDFYENVWYWTEGVLKETATEIAAAKQLGGVEIDGYEVSTDGDALAYYDALYEDAINGLPSDERAFSTSPTECINRTNEYIVNFVKEVRLHLQNCAEALRVVHEMIDSEGTDKITDPSQIQTAFDGAYEGFLAYPIERDQLSLTAVIDARVADYMDVNGNEANGPLILDGDGKVPSGRLPGYVDDVIDVSDYASLPSPGEAGKLYILGTPYNGNTQFRWTGSAYTHIVQSPGTTDAVVEGSVNLYFTAARARAAAKAVIDTTVISGAFMVAKSAVVSGGNAVFHLTDDGLSTGNHLGANGNVHLDSMNFRADNEVDAPHTYGTPVLSNSNKTVTVPVKKTAGTYISLLGITLLGQPTAANGSTIKMQCLVN